MTNPGVNQLKKPPAIPIIYKNDKQNKKRIIEEKDDSCEEFNLLSPIIKKQKINNKIMKSNSEDLLQNTNIDNLETKQHSILDSPIPKKAPNVISPTNEMRKSNDSLVSNLKNDDYDSNVDMENNNKKKASASSVINEKNLNDLSDNCMDTLTINDSIDNKKDELHAIPQIEIVDRNETTIKILNPYLKKNKDNSQINSNEDIDINAISKGYKLLGINPIRKIIEHKKHAILQCATIDSEDSQSVVFWCDEPTQSSYLAQLKIRDAITKGKNWVKFEVPFINEDSRWYLAKGNRAVYGFNGRFRIQLFYYINEIDDIHPRQTKDQIYDTGCKIAQNVNIDCNVSITVTKDTLFAFNKPCKWSSILTVEDTLLKLKNESNDIMSTQLVKNIYFWDKHQKIIRKYFFEGKLSVEIADILNAPIEELDNSILRTPELIQSVASRRNAILKMGTYNINYLENFRDPENNIGYLMHNTNAASDVNHENDNKETDFAANGIDDILRSI